jgi:hypothetical protein
VSEFHDLDRRVAVLEQIAADTRDALHDIRWNVGFARTAARRVKLSSLR